MFGETVQPGAGRTLQQAGRREWLGLAVLALACLVYAMDLTVLHLAVPTISADLHPSSVQLLWIIDIYGFMVAGSLITMGTIGDRVGRRRLLLGGAAAFAVVSIIAACSTSATMLIATRALLGIAGATVAPSTLSLIFTMFADPRQRATAVGIWVSAFSAGGAIGPVLGGMLLEHFWWGSVFLLAVPPMCLLLALGPRLLPEYRAPSAGRVDPVSALLSLTAILALIWGFKEMAQSGVEPSVLLAILSGLSIGVLFVRRQLAQVDPMVDPRLFHVPAFSAALVIYLMSIFMAFGYFLFVAQYLQLVLGLSPLRAGLWSMPSALGFIVGSQFAPWLTRRARPAVVIGSGLTLAAVGLLILMRIDATGDLTPLVAASLIISLGLAPVITLTTDLIVGTAPPEQAGVASGISETCGELGGALGIAILGSVGAAVYRRTLTSDLPASVPHEAAVAARDTLGGAVDAAAQLPGDTGETLLAVARDAFVQGMHLTSAIAAVVALLGVLVAVIALRNLTPLSPDEPERTDAEFSPASPVQAGD